MKIFFKYYLLFILIIPYGLIKITSIYNITTPPVIDYDYLDYKFIIITIAFLFNFFTKIKKYIKLE